MFCGDEHIENNRIFLKKDESVDSSQNATNQFNTKIKIL